MHSNNLNVNKVHVQTENMKKAATIDNGSITTLPPLVIKRASLPLKFELVLAFWKTKDHVEFSDIIQVNASRSPSQLLNTNNIL